jgi:valyl-tRNA synthetase
VTARSVHRAPWPSAADFQGIEAPAVASSFDVAIAALAAINKAKADAAVSVGREVVRLTLQANAETLTIFAGVRSDVLSAARVAHGDVQAVASLAPGELVVKAIEFADRPVGDA